jgi:hypothetical protein
MTKYLSSANRRVQNCPEAVGKNIAISVSLKRYISVFTGTHKKIEDTENFVKLPAATLLKKFFHVILLLARIKLVRQSF